MKYFLNFVALIFIFTVFNISDTSAQTQKLTVGNLKGSNYLGCGCSSQTLAEAKKPRSQKIVFWSEDINTAVFNINGKDTIFKLTKKGKRPAKQIIGSRFSDEYTANGIIVKVDYSTTYICRKGDLECEATSYDVTLTATKADFKTVLRTKGTCGC